MRLILIAKIFLFLAFAAMALLQQGPAEPPSAAPAEEEAAPARWGPDHDSPGGGKGSSCSGGQEHGCDHGHN